MARYRRARRHYSKKMTLPIAVIAPLAYSMATPAQRLMAGDINGAMDALRWSFTGINQAGQFDFNGLKSGLLPVVGGLLIHKFVGGAPLNLNRSLSSAGVPLVRI